MNDSSLGLETRGLEWILSTLTESELRTAVRRGHGRAILYLRSRADQGYFDLVLDLASHEQAFDGQFEDRIDYMWRLAKTLPNPEPLIAPLGERLITARNRRNRMQVRNVLARFRREGSAEALEFLLRDFRRLRLSERPFDEAIHLLGFAGLELLAKQLHRLETWEIRSAFKEAVEEFGEERVIRFFQETAPRNEVIRQIMSGQAPERNPPRRRVLPTAVELIAKFMEGERLSPMFEHVANLSDWIEVATIVAESADVSVLSRAHFTLKRRPWPLDMQASLDQALAEPSDHLRNLRLSTLEATRHPALRRFALEQLGISRKPKSSYIAFRLLRLNALPRDLPLLEKALRTLEQDEDTFHFASIDVLNLRIRPTTELLQLVYEFGSCSLCRNGAFKLLRKRRALTPAQLEECLEDSDDYTQELARKSLRRQGLSMSVPA